MDDVYFEIAPNDEYGNANNLFDAQELRAFSFRLDDPDPLETWPDLRWQLPDNRCPDVVWALVAVRLVSPLVKEVFTDLAGPRDVIQWLPATAVDRDGREHPYWVPHFPVHEDVLDERHTNYGPGGLPIRWVLASRKLEGLGVFTIPRLSMRYVIHERIGAALAEAGATGYTSERARSV
jgi:hypothetical protein